MKSLMFLLLIGGVVACDDGTSGIALEFQPGVTAGALTVGGGFEVTRLEALVREVKLLPGKNELAEEKEEKFKAKGDFWVDALNPDDSIIPTVPLPAETYKKVEFKFEKTKDGLGIDGTDAAIALDVTIGDIDVELRIKDSQKVTLRHVDGIAVRDGLSSTFLILLDIPSWFAGVDVAQLEADVDGVVVIDTQTNKVAYDAVRANLQAAIKLARKP